MPLAGSASFRRRSVRRQNRGRRPPLPAMPPPG